jgi:hypothetical protein
LVDAEKNQEKIESDLSKKRLKAAQLEGSIDTTKNEI